jgi:pilus assembly protein CpaB
LLRRSKTIVFNDDPDSTDAEPMEAPVRPSLRRNLEALRNATLRVAESPAEVAEEPAEPADNPVQQRFDRLRDELEQAPITKGSQESLQALREEFRRKHVGNADDQSVPSRPSFSLSGLRFSRILLIIVALIAGGTAAWLALGRQPEPEPVPAAIVEPPPPPPTVEVLVAKSAIPPGTRLTADLLEWQKWPEETVRAEYVTSAVAPEAIDSYATSVARGEILAGEPIRPEKLSEAGSGFLSSILAPGTRGVSVEIDAKAASGGFIVPNDHVDVVLTRQVGNELISQTILSDVRVIAINAKLGDTTAPADPDAPEEKLFPGVALATLELNSSQAELIISAVSRGGLSLVLRPQADTATSSDSTAQAVNETIRLTSPFWRPAPPSESTASGGIAPIFPGQQ